MVLLRGLLALTVLALGSVGLAQTGPGSFDRDPVIFVHGSSGSAAQFSAQAQRFSTQGYPDEWLAVVEYDTGNLDFPEDFPVVFAEIDARIAELRAATGRDDVVLMGHSLGTSVSQAYLADPARAANVSAYVNIDGRPAASLPGGVRTLALWAGAVNRSGDPQVVGGRNVTIPDQEHIEVATSAEAFAEMYDFITGEPPTTTDVAPEFGVIELAGRATIFPDNVGATGASLNVWAVNRASGRRVGRTPVATYEIDEAGYFGPFAARPFVVYEFALERQDGFVYNFFYEPFVRSDQFVRLNTSRAGEGIGAFIPTSPDMVSVNVNRNYEFWGDRPGRNDRLIIDRNEVINPATAPSGFVGASSTIFAFDAGLDGQTNVDTVPFPFSLIGFLSASDVYIPVDARSPLRVISVPRGENRPRIVPARRIPSSEARVTVTLRDY